ncbi:hypothetical protein M9H77_18464 [Catharanthus roseus]|uniref:Uncharacterized protein n=1 Tax=Catharanthus roseus TaxID=4058 RepID=A0ACC0B7J1_CATRO|nr:hypothetical protein M9H77_18464 [Catharanthus roseus]
MCPLYDGIMSSSYGPLGAGPICCQIVSDFFNLLFPPTTPEGPKDPGVSVNTSSEDLLSRIYKDSPPIVDRLQLTNFTTLFARSISPTLAPYALKTIRCHSNPGHIKVNLLLLLTKNHLIPIGPAAHLETLEWDADWNRWRGNRKPRCIKPMKHLMGRCGSYVKRVVPTPKSPRRGYHHIATGFKLGSLRRVCSGSI